jgi:hypothetical protein
VVYGTTYPINVVLSRVGTLQETTVPAFDFCMCVPGQFAKSVAAKHDGVVFEERIAYAVRDVFVSDAVQHGKDNLVLFAQLFGGSKLSRLRLLERLFRWKDSYNTMKCVCGKKEVCV